MNKTINYRSADCARELLYVQFNKDIKHETGLTFCQAIQEFALGPNQSANVDSGAIHFFSETPGQINSQVTFRYTIDGKPEQITQPYSFNILPSIGNDGFLPNFSKNDFKLVNFGIENHNPFVVVQGIPGRSTGDVEHDYELGYVFYTNKGIFGAWSDDPGRPLLSSHITQKKTLLVMHV